MSRVLVVDANRYPLAPCTPRRARLLLNSGKAAVLRRYPFTIILKQSYPTASPRPVRLKLDPGSKTTGIAVVTEATGEVVWAAELQHRGQLIKDALESRRSLRRGRRNRKTRYALLERLKATGLPVEIASGGRTKFNRVKQQIPKTHWLDAACVGASTPEVLRWEARY